MISEIGYFLKESKGVEELANASYLALTHIVQMGKTLPLLLTKTRLLNLINSINQKHFQPKTNKQTQMLDSYIWFSQALIWMAVIASLITCSFWAIGPIIEERKIVLHMAMWIPFDASYSPISEIVYMYQVITPIILAWGISAGDIMITGNKNYSYKNTVKL